MHILRLQRRANRPFSLVGLFCDHRPSDTQSLEGLAGGWCKCQLVVLNFAYLLDNSLLVN